MAGRSFRVRVANNHEEEAEEEAGVERECDEEEAGTFLAPDPRGGGGADADDDGCAHQNEARDVRPGEGGEGEQESEHRCEHGNGGEDGFRFGVRLRGLSKKGFDDEGAHGELEFHRCGRAGFACI